MNKIKVKISQAEYRILVAYIAYHYRIMRVSNIEELSVFNINLMLLDKIHKMYKIEKERHTINLTCFEAFIIIRYILPLMETCESKEAIPLVQALSQTFKREIEKQTEHTILLINSYRTRND